MRKLHVWPSNILIQTRLEDNLWSKRERNKRLVQLYGLKASMIFFHSVLIMTEENNKQMKQMQTLVSYHTSLFYWIIPQLNTIAPSEAINTRHNFFPLIFKKR